MAEAPRFPPSTPQGFQRELQGFARIAVGAVQPDRVVQECAAIAEWVHLHGDAGYVLIAAGKAAARMVRGLASLPQRASKAVVIAPDGQAAEVRTVMPDANVLEADHPLPTARSVDAGRAAYEVAAEAGRDGKPLLILLSGGASAMMCLPAEGVALDDLREMTQGLLRAGADIDELNCVRKHCEQLKGGRLARLAQSAHVAAFVISDVVGNRLETIASGPTVEDPTTYAEALAILNKRGLQNKAPSVWQHIERGARGEREETPKPGQLNAERIKCQVIADNAMAIDAVRGSAREAGYEVVVRAHVQGESRRQAAEFVGELRRSRARSSTPVCLIWGGETTVSLSTAADAAVGGRNHEAALAAAIMIDGDPAMAAAFIATDGLDGNTGAAGAIVTGPTAMMARRSGHDPEDYLARHDSGTFFKNAAPAAEQLRCGATGTNVNDIWIGLAR